MDQQIQRSEIALRMALRNEGYKYRNANLLSLFFLTHALSGSLTHNLPSTQEFQRKDVPFELELIGCNIRTF